MFKSISDRFVTGARTAGVAISLAALPVLALADGEGGVTVDIGPITAAQGTVGAVGAAVFAVVVIIAAYRWARRSL